MAVGAGLVREAGVGERDVVLVPEAREPCARTERSSLKSAASVSIMPAKVREGHVEGLPVFRLHLPGVSMMTPWACACALRISGIWRVRIAPS